MKERPILMSGPMVRAIIEGRKTQTRRVVKFGGHFRWKLEKLINYPAGETSAVFRGADDRYGWADCPHARVVCPYGKPGDRLWVRETWRIIEYPKKTTIGDSTGGHAGVSALIQYREGELPGGYGEPLRVGNDRRHCEITSGEYTGQLDAYPASGKSGTWRPSIHMPRWASRLTLEVVSVRVERLQDISEEDAEVEGIDPAWDDGLPDDKWGPAWAASERKGGLTLFGMRSGFAVYWDSLAKPGEKWADNPWVWCLTFKPVEVAK